MEAFDFTLPAITDGGGAGDLLAAQRYLFRLGEQLNFAFGSIQTQVQQVQLQAEKTETAVAAIKPATPKKTFADLKSLIIKSAEIVDAYYEKISQRLSGMYVAQSEFGTFRQDVSADLTATAEGLTQIYNNIQAIESNVSEIADSVLEVNAYIRTGVLYYDAEATPVYGVEIGQRNEVDGALKFQKYTRLTANRLAFFDQNDNEVAYITDRILHITIAEIQQLTASTANIDRLLMGNYMISAGGDGHLTIN